MDNGFMRALSRIADLMILNIIFLICCIPIVTIGPATTAMYYVTMKMSTNEEGYIVRGFFKSFKQNFKQALVIWIGLLVTGIVLWMDLAILRNATGTIYTAMRVAIMVTLIFYIMLLLYVFPTLARFYNSIRTTLKNSVIMAIADFPRTLVMVAIIIAAFFVTLYNGYTFWYGLLFWLMLGFATVAYANSYFFKQIFAKYIPEEEKPETDDLFDLDKVEESDLLLPPEEFSSDIENEDSDNENSENEESNEES